jgi:hypothetical protein
MLSQESGMKVGLGVQAAPPLLQETFVGDLMGEGVLEGLFEFREEAGFVEEVSGLQVGERAAQGLIGELCDGLQLQEGHVRPDDGRVLE